MNCRLFSQHENYTTESQIVKLIYDIMILTARSMLLKSNCPKKIPMPKHEFPFIPIPRIYYLYLPIISTQNFMDYFRVIFNPLCLSDIDFTGSTQAMIYFRYFRSAFGSMTFTILRL